MNYRFGTHSALQVKYHFDCVTKYRCKILRGEIEGRVSEMD